MKIAKIRVFRRNRLLWQQPVCTCQRLLQVQGSSLGSIVGPAFLRLQLHVCNSFALYLQPVCPECSQAHQKETCVKGASVDPTAECFGFDLNAAFGQQLRKLTDVQSTLGYGVLQQLACERLPKILRGFCLHSHSREYFLQAASLLEYVACLQHLFHDDVLRKVIFKVTKMSPSILLMLYFDPNMSLGTSAISGAVRAGAGQHGS